jgi:superfamily II DNA/RNA helicase
LVFCNRKKDVDIVNKSFQKHGFNSATLHGDMVQSARMGTMEKFKAREYDFLICSDVAARGLDIDDLSHVFNYDVPMHAEDYVHRIGRTGRAGKQGRAFSLAWKEDKKYIDAIEKLTGKQIPLIQINKTSAQVEATSKAEKTEIKIKAHSNPQTNPQKKATDEPAKSSVEFPKVSEVITTKTNKKAQGSQKSEVKPAKSRMTKTDQIIKDNVTDLNEDSWGSHMPAFLMRHVK